MSVQKALISLSGLSTGDAFGEQFFNQPPSLIEQRQLPPGRWHWTDDTHMALSIVEVLQAYGEIDQDALAQAFARRYQEQPYRGYGSGARRLLERVSRGEDWGEVAPELFPGGSYGNGGAMRVAPLGGYFAGEPEKAAEQGRLSAEVTHAHPEGQAGAMAVAAAAAMATETDFPRGADFIQAVLRYVPQGETQQGLKSALEIPPQEYETAVRNLGTGRKISAQDTVPFCIWCAAYHLDDYADALWTTVAGLGDRDTTCAMVGGITALSSGQVPAEWLRRREPLPAPYSENGG